MCENILYYGGLKLRNSSFLSIKNIVAIGIGSAVFLVLGRFGSIPTGIPNTNLEVAYAFLALMAIIYGPVSGFLIGFIGHALKDMLFYGTPWFSWVIASAVVGLIVGLSYKFVDLENFNKLKKQGYTDLKAVYLATLNQKNELSVYSTKEKSKVKFFE